MSAGGAIARYVAVFWQGSPRQVSGIALTPAARYAVLSNVTGWLGYT